MTDSGAPGRDAPVTSGQATGQAQAQGAAGPDGPGPVPAGPVLAGPGGPGWPQRLRSLGPGRLAALAAVVLGIAAIVVLSLTGTGAPQQATAVQAKNFTLAELGNPGRQLSLNSLAGRPVIVNFFASWCTPCRRETPMLARFFRARHGQVHIIGIDVSDTTRSALAFVHRTGVAYPVVTEPSTDATVIAYDLPGLPDTFFLNSQHQIVKRVYGAVTRAELAAGAALIGQRAH
jgi:cytochrome c biogenesis protein CcmG, thiol:disulfide interchange protein DsbE